MTLLRFEAQMKLLFKPVFIFTVVCSVLTHCLINNTVLTLAAGEWLKGKNCTPVCLSMKTGSHTKTYKEGHCFPKKHYFVVAVTNYFGSGFGV
jgi:hypothetical protein